MKITVQRLMEATMVVEKIIGQHRAMPLTGKFRLARLHAKLWDEYAVVNAQRDAMIRAYDTHVMVADENGDFAVQMPEFTVPADKMPEFTEAWSKIAAEEIEIDIEPIPLACLDLGDNVDGSIETTELIMLGDLVTE